MRLLGLIGMLAGLMAIGEPMLDADGQAKFLAASRGEHNPKVTWKQVESYSFDRAEEMASFHVVDGEWVVQDGALVAAKGKADRNRTIMLMPVTWDFVRLSFDVTMTARPADGRIGDVCVRFGDKETGSFAKHYTAITGQYWNQAGVVYRKNIPIARTEWSPLVSGKTVRVVMEFTRIHLRYWVDGKVVLEAWDREDPVDVKGTWLGISTYDTLMRVDNLLLESGEPLQMKRRKKK